MYAYTRQGRTHSLLSVIPCTILAITLNRLLQRFTLVNEAERLNALFPICIALWLAVTGDLAGFIVWWRTQVTATCYVLRRHVALHRASHGTRNFEIDRIISRVQCQRIIPKFFNEEKDSAKRQHARAVWLHVSHMVCLEAKQGMELRHTR